MPHRACRLSREGPRRTIPRRAARHSHSRNPLANQQRTDPSAISIPPAPTNKQFHEQRSKQYKKVQYRTDQWFTRGTIDWSKCTSSIVSQAPRRRNSAGWPTTSLTPPASRSRICGGWAMSKRAGWRRRVDVLATAGIIAAARGAPQARELRRSSLVRLRPRRRARTRVRPARAAARAPRVYGYICPRARRAHRCCRSGHSVVQVCKLCVLYTRELQSVKL